MTKYHLQDIVTWNLTATDGEKQNKLPIKQGDYLVISLHMRCGMPMYKQEVAYFNGEMFISYLFPDSDDAKLNVVAWSELPGAQIIKRCSVDKHGKLYINTL